MGRTPSNEVGETREVNPGAFSLVRGYRKSEVVYFVRARSLGLIKIGVASCIHRRLAELQTGSPDALDVLRVWRVPEPRGWELHLHRMFADERRHGEWFEPSERLLRFIEAMGCSAEADFEKRARSIIARLPHSTRPSALITGNCRAAKLARYKADRGLTT